MDVSIEMNPRIVVTRVCAIAHGRRYCFRDEGGPVDESGWRHMHVEPRKRYSASEPSRDHRRVTVAAAMAH